MSLQSHFTNIKQFLEKHQYLHELEVLERSPFEGDEYIIWARDLNELSCEQMISLENNYDTKNLTSPGYINFLEEIKTLSKLETQPKSTFHIPKHLKRKLSLKKQHEIEIIKTQLSDLDFEHYIDIGSGAAHLSSILLCDNKHSALCIDSNSIFQQIGIKKLKRYAPEILDRIEFKTQEFKNNSTLPHRNKSILLGLHACGDLSVDLIQYFRDSNLSSLLNYGCCFHKLSAEHINISQLSKESPVLKLTNHALTMASKSFRSLSNRGLKERTKVKNSRYTLHLFMKEELNLEFIGLGNAKKKDYFAEFSDYAKSYLPQAQSFTNKKLNLFYANKISQVKTIQNLGVIRSHLSRLIEIYISLDRAIFLEEAGYKTSVCETFSKELSPRNIGIFAEK